MEFENLPYEEQEHYTLLAAELLDGQLYCTRTWVLIYISIVFDININI